MEFKDYNTIHEWLFIFAQPLHKDLSGKEYRGYLKHPPIQVT